MALKTRWKKHTLEFLFDAGTSRGILRTRTAWLVAVSRPGQPEIKGWGEAAPLPGLSPDALPDFETHLEHYLHLLSNENAPSTREEALDMAQRIVPAAFPSIRFAVEVALLDLLEGGRQQPFPGPFAAGEYEIPINGLIWMGDPAFMEKQMQEKLMQGFTCIKMKVGAIALQEEIRQLRKVRETNPPEQLILRVDANGAFDPRHAKEQLAELSPLGLHSIEQPIQPGQRTILKHLCECSPVPIALDEELISVIETEEKERLLDEVKPYALVLKPSLHGGVQGTAAWIRLAEERKMAWWITSALESNIGLNAIAQFTAAYKPLLHQGLGTGKLYHNNFVAPLFIKNGKIGVDTAKDWMLPALESI